MDLYQGPILVLEYRYWNIRIKIPVLNTANTGKNQSGIQYLAVFNTGIQYREKSRAVLNTGIQYRKKSERCSIPIFGTGKKAKRY
jgi:predicted secreted Zn-dependent protease